ncbi:MAG: T9SS type A sorting domain-containing protein [Bacteroidetes bacterium]|nr:T9SS type A sorting domain-containing protein [Bacteroidota bacterium]
MRKVLLAFLSLPVFAVAQQVENIEAQKAAPNAPHVLKESTVKSPVIINQGTLHPTGVTGKEWLFKEVEIGTTTYDLQTNNALGNRVHLYPDGSLSTTFTFAGDGSPFVSRGTGYVHYDGTDWSTAPTARLEPKRTGWSNIGVVNVDGKDREFVVSHHANHVADDPSGGFYILMNDAIGSSNFSVVEEVDIAKDGPMWPRAVGQGSYIHIFCATNPDKGKPVNGIRRPNIYYRYDAKENKFLDEGITLPGYDSTRIFSGRSDSYLMDANDNAVAIVSGGTGQDLFVWKSTDNGDNWDVLVDSFPVPRWVGNDVFADTFESNTGSVAVLLDDSDKVHVFYGRSRVMEDLALEDSNSSFFPGVTGMVYWNEYTKNPSIIAGMPDLDGNGQLEFFEDQTTLENGARYNYNTISCFPNAGIADDGTIYLVYSTPTESQVSPDGPLYRDVWVVYSEDGGETWSDAVTLIDNYSEDVFAHIARTVDDYIHVVWQRDDYPGNHVQNGHRETINKMMYAAVPTSLIKSGALKPLRSGVEDIIANFNVAQAYPNPANNVFNLSLELTQSTQLNVTITNTLGQTVMQENLGKLPLGNQSISLDISALNSGVYVYTVIGQTGRFSGELIVE